MKILCICSALDIRYRFGCTPNWWQFMKGLYELGHDVIAIPYLGTAIESPWWRAYPNPCEFEGKTFSAVKKWLGENATSTKTGAGGRLAGVAIESWIRPRWEHRLTDALETERDIDAVILFTAPLNHFTGIPDRLRRRFHVPFFYFDGDVPASLPRFGGFASGFKIYEGADISEYDGVMCNSTGGCEDILTLGAKRVKAIHWGVDPDLYAPIDIEEDRDVYFYGIGCEYREEWIEAMMVRPSLELTEYSFQVGGRNFNIPMGNVIETGDVPFNVFRQACCRSRINLNITRQAHASVFASSTSRPFELACMARCVISNPYSGLETWFDIGKDMLVVESPEEALNTIRRLLENPSERAALGASARKRVLECHTHRQRAADIVEFISHT